MKTQIAKWGNSLAVRIPKPVALAAKLKEGEDFEVDAEGPGSVSIRKPNPKLTLAELVSCITPENQHSATDWGEAVGKELW
jgi:antitoxin MazE